MSSDRGYETCPPYISWSSPQWQLALQAPPPHQVEATSSQDHLPAQLPSLPPELLSGLVLGQKCCFVMILA